MNLKLKWSLIFAAHTIIPLVICVLGPWVGLHPKPGMRPYQLYGGLGMIAFFAVVDWLQYGREVRLKALFDGIRARGSRMVSVGYDVRP